MTPFRLDRLPAKFPLGSSCTFTVAFAIRGCGSADWNLVLATGSGCHLTNWTRKNLANGAPGCYSPRGAISQGRFRRKTRSGSTLRSCPSPPSPPCSCTS
jgi:hypothetical protein